MTISAPTIFRAFDAPEYGMMPPIGRTEIGRHVVHAESPWQATTMRLTAFDPTVEIGPKVVVRKSPLSVDSQGWNYAGRRVGPPGIRYWPRQAFRPSTTITIQYASAVDGPDISRVPSHTNVLPAAFLGTLGGLRETGLEGKQLSRLVAIGVDRELGGAGLRKVSAASLNNTAKTLQDLGQGLGRATVSVSPKGLVQTTWRKSGGYFVLEFQEDGRVFFSLMADRYPLDGVIAPGRLEEFKKMMAVRQDNPLLWGKKKGNADEAKA